MEHHNIKELKPHKNGHFKQGYIDPSKCKKLFESCRNKPIIYRSSWEKIFADWCERNSGVESWGSECISIPYIYNVDGQEHLYYPDFVVKMKNGITFIVEVKPFSQTQKPTGNNPEKIATWMKNMCKWKTVQKWCSTQPNTKFWIVTEKSIKQMI